jgi:hypothetical protein
MYRLASKVGALQLWRHAKQSNTILKENKMKSVSILALMLFVSTSAFADNHAKKADDHAAAAATPAADAAHSSEKPAVKKAKSDEKKASH